ncbi:hypothetical protein EI53_01219 [Fusobacterium naviforme]|nr:hypothetical protein F7P78_06100 [Fusobacterium naviforme]PSL10157.1 hypothetical protein EI53_01219 [Fusobacterium naviforme]STO27567.1 Uncharacterised protein [Fusobacterium naviforme]
MDFRELYKKHEDGIERIDETERAEESLSGLLAKLKAEDKELYFDIDSAIGALARAYEKQGFRGGLKAARATV